MRVHVALQPCVRNCACTQWQSAPSGSSGSSRLGLIDLCALFLSTRGGEEGEIRLARDLQTYYLEYPGMWVNVCVCVCGSDSDTFTVHGMWL